MSKYYIIGYNNNDIDSGKEFQLLDAAEKVIFDPRIISTERNNVLIYSADKVDNDFRETFGDYLSYSFIKETVMSIISENLKLNVLGVVDESKLPEKLSISIKL